MIKDIALIIYGTIVLFLAQNEKKESNEESVGSKIADEKEQPDDDESKTKSKKGDVDQVKIFSFLFDFTENYNFCCVLIS